MTLTDRLILGCARLTGGASAAEADALVRAVLDAGVRHVDTAPSYGMGTAEAVVGRALRRFGGPVRVTAKLGSARDRHALAKSWLRRAKRALGGSGSNVWQQSGPPAVRIGERSGHDFRARAMRLSLDISRERLGRIDYLLLHDVTAAKVNEALLADVAELASSVSAAAGYASRAQWDADLDARFPAGHIRQCAMAPGWFDAGSDIVEAGLFLHSIVKAGAARRIRDAAFGQRLDRAARLIGSGDVDADRIAALCAAAGAALPQARLVIASSHRRRLEAVLRAIMRVDGAENGYEIAAVLTGSAAD